MTSTSLQSREIALSVFAAVLDRNRPLEEAFGDAPGLASLDGRDRAFARLIVATALRRLGQIDFILGNCLERPLPAKEKAIGHLLRLGTAQLLFIETAPHAAVSTAVELAATHSRGRFKGLVNGVLRRISREGAGWLAAQDSARLNTPDWLWEPWVRDFGEDTARRIAEAHLTEPPLDLSVKADAAHWAGRLDGQVLSTGSVRRPLGGAVIELPGYAEGAWWVQDAAAALPARLLGDVTGKRVLDLCAAPGGKTLQLAAAGAQVTALDRSENRMKRLGDNLARVNLQADMVIADAAKWRPETPFDAILLDAPCSATGTLRRHPDVAHHRGPADVAKLVALQDRLLNAARAMLAPGGTLVYCTCSLLADEGEQRIAALMESGSDLRRQPIQPTEIGGLSECLSAEGDLRTLPCHLTDQAGMDGFFAARLRAP
ncbi:RsmB/NOP family class I SAM-dependent RNA methyltransferase [Magnetospira sp. QH-2]|uniref:RsmB/NOP family class I SAM-dependent RNA methyltransferase n=1 Tax=Magnetospira sp. (strain QH-2) TaxID=1288970 RepID=UPI0003E80B4F|nr:transcription antitermination factor NusB [Magnetospira sp. QH-2]CCQ75530.1 S-adenosyl-methionine (AdoMet)-dependent RNA m5C methyltransferases [Magnetospira sp. QH-2]